jgi:hypothetical protein
MAYEGKRDSQGLTPAQATVLEHYLAGHGPNRTALVTGMSVTQICNIKYWLKNHGYPVQIKTYAKAPVKEIDIATFLAEIDVPRSEHEPEDDEQPDDDEPAFTDLERCHCGLAKPCYHPIRSVWDSGDGNHPVAEQNPSEIEPLQSTRVRRAL